MLYVYVRAPLQAERERLAENATFITNELIHIRLIKNLQNAEKWRAMQELVLIVDADLLTRSFVLFFFTTILLFWDMCL